MSSTLDSVTTFFGGLKDQAQNVVDRFFPPEKRAEVLSKLQMFAASNPKLAAFLLTNIALTGFPLFMFGVFTLTVFVFSLIVALLVALLAALLFTVFMVGVALIFVLPTVFLTTMAASFIFLWGLGGYYIIKWFNAGQDGAPQGDAIGDKLNSLTGGRLNFLMDGARKKNEADQKSSTDQGESMDIPKPSDAKGTITNATKQTDGAPRKLNQSTGGATKPATNAVGTAKGAVNGATGLG